MKKIFILLFLTYSYVTIAQVTLVSGGTTLIPNGSVFAEAIPTAAPYAPLYSWGLIYDPGTTVYSIDNPQTGFQGNLGFDYIIWRHNNYWKIARFRYAPILIQEFFETVAQYNSPILPCTALWKSMNTLDQVYPPGQFSFAMGPISILNLTGSNTSCLPSSPILCGVNVQCEGIQMAPLGTNTLNSLNVQAGFLAYDATSNSLSWYDGNSWNKISTLEKGPIQMPIKNISGSYSIINEDYAVVYIGLGSHTVTLPGHGFHVGRTISIINKSSASINLSPSIANFGATLAPGSQVLLITDGAGWLKMN
jgi:hypothetical protein